MNARINHVAVWILVVVYFLIGWGWYAIWGDTWLNLHAKTATDIERTHNVGAYVLAFVASIVVNYALAWLIMKLNAQRAVCGLGVALICWFAFVFMEYICYLRRNPDQDGYDHWLAKLRYYGNWVDAELVQAFIISPEYRARFTP